MIWNALLSSLLLAVAPAAPETPAGGLPRGEIVPKIVCASDAEQSYALYLPSNFSADRKWPILYLHDPRRHGADAVGLFRAAAEKYGWMLAGSNNTESDGPMAPNIKAMAAVWEDTHRSLPIDAGRVYATGFSGGARAASLLGQKTEGKVAGVIGCGAGFADQSPPEKDLPFVFFGTVGNTDFNYREMRRLDVTLEKLSATHRLSVFDGPHRWPPEEVCGRAVEWMELQAMRRGTRPRDDRLLAEWLAAASADAAGRESAGKKGEALERYREIAVDFEGLSDLAAVRANVDRLEKDRDATRALERQATLEATEDRTESDLFQKLLSALKSDDPVAPRRLVQDLRIPSLRTTAESGATEAERLSAKRIIAALFVQTSFYLPREYLGKHDMRRARLCNAVALEARPDRAGNVMYNFACMQAQNGDRPGALTSLESAVEKGFRDASLLETDPDLETLRADANFQKLLQKVKSEPKP
jgi:predicted esterase